MKQALSQADFSRVQVLRSGEWLNGFVVQARYCLNSCRQLMSSSCGQNEKNDE